MRGWRWLLSLRMNHLYFRILTYFLFLLIPTIVVGSIVYFANLHIFREQMVDKVTSNLISSSKMIDIYLRTIEQTGMNFLLNGTVQKYLLPVEQQTDSDKEQSLAITKTLSLSRNIVDPFIDDLFVYMDTELVYNSEGVEHFASFFNKFSRYSDYDEEYWESLLDKKFSFQILNPTTISKSYSEKREVIIPLVLSQYIQGNRAVMVFNISSSKMMGMLKRSSIDHATQFFVTDPNRNVLVSDPQLHPEWSNLIVDVVSGSSHSFDEITLGGRTSVITSHKSEYGWIYYSITPTASYKEQANGILMVTSWLSLLLIIIGIIFSFIFSTKLYNPIRNMLNAQNKHDQFSAEWLESAFTSILNGNQLEKYDMFMQEIGFEDGEYVCCCIKLHYKEAFFQEIQDTDRMLILEKMKKVISGILQQYVSTYVIEIQSRLYVAIVNLKEPGDRAKLDEALRSVMLTFSYDSKYCLMAVGVGRAYSHISGLSQSYGDAKIALASNEQEAGFQIVDASSLPIKDHFHFSFTDETRIINGLKLGNMALLETEIKSLIESNLQRGISHLYLNLLLIELYNIGIKYSTEKGVSPFGLLQDSEHLILVGKSPHYLDFHEHLSLLLRFYKEILDKVEMPESNRSGQLVAQMITYIDENYAQDLYLDRIANEMGLSSKYISRLFKEVIGTTLTDYINMKRVAEAKRMLETTNIKNDEIALRIGIQSRATFFRLFKKHEGMTPQDYRRMVCKDKEERI